MVNSRHSIHSCTIGTSVSSGNCRTKSEEFVQDSAVILFVVNDWITTSIFSIASLSSCGVSAFAVARELHHRFGLTMRFVSSLVASLAGRSLGGTGNPGIQLFGT